MNEQQIEKLLTTAELAEFFKVTRQTVMNWRVQNRGPKFLKFAHTVRYRLSDVQAFIEGSEIAG